MVSMTSNDGNANVQVSGVVADSLPSGSVFGSIEQASDFFAAGSLGYSDSHQAGNFDGLELQCENWKVQALQVDSVRSSYFQDTTRFPEGTVEFDCALLMRGIVHEWHGRADLCCG